MSRSPGRESTRLPCAGIDKGGVGGQLSSEGRWRRRSRVVLVRRRSAVMLLSVILSEIVASGFLYVGSEVGFEVD